MYCIGHIMCCMEPYYAHQGIRLPRTSHRIAAVNTINFNEQIKVTILISSASRRLVFRIVRVAIVYPVLQISALARFLNT